ncbi:MAG: MBL fold metallo-hydrolase [Deltaproteobacteria bacterium]|nr:MBL fold metallo-hydrolase [Deltaproteobacteria bacterium]
MRFSVLTSGSKANCTYVESGSTRILIDCGLSARQTEVRLRALGIDPASLDAIIVTHEHSDHINGVPVMSRRFELPVYANEGTSSFLRGVFALEKFVTGKSFSIGELNIAPFSIVHDAHEPVGFSIEGQGIKFSQATDLGKVTPLVREALRGSHAVVLESNHDHDMLQNCDYPWELKQRISSSHGHLSNESSSAFLAELLHGDLQHVVLGHLSENSNTPELALKAAQSQLSAHSLATLMCACIANETPLLSL